MLSSSRHANEDRDQTYDGTMDHSSVLQLDGNRLIRKLHEKPGKKGKEDEDRGEK